MTLRRMFEDLASQRRGAAANKSEAKKTLAGAGTASRPVWHRTLSPEQREAYAAWIVERLSRWMHHEEMRAVLTCARRLINDKGNAPPKGARVVEAFKRGRGNPGKWQSAAGIQMVREVEISMLVTGKTEADAVEDQLENWHRFRFPEESRANLRRGYKTAAKWVAALDE
jgi:hypothetical protein